MAQRALVVLESFQAPRRTTNPYIVMLLEALRATPGLQVRTFDWRTALLARVDVLHVHWPEILLRGPSPLKTARRQLLFALLLARLVLTRVAVVRTVHNLAPHDAVSRREAALLAALDRLTTARILINAAADPPPGESAVIVHGHYRDWFARYERDAAVPGRISTFGLIKPYKGVERLIEAFADAARADGDLSLHVAGKPATDRLASELAELAAGSGRVRLDLAYVEDADLVRLVSASELVAFPYRQMHNSGGVLAALSLDRPVLVPDNQVNRRLAAEVGPGWVHLFTGDLTGETLREALAAAREGSRGERPDLSLREWARTGHDHAALFRRAVTIRRGRR